jgi:hypothetical protein
MNAILKRLHSLDNDELMEISAAVDAELDRRAELFADEVPESARQRAIARSQSYRRSAGSSAAPIRAVGLRGLRRDRAA